MVLIETRCVKVTRLGLLFHIRVLRVLLQSDHFLEAQPLVMPVLVVEQVTDLVKLTLF